MIKIIDIKNLEQLEKLKQGDTVACEFYRNVGYSGENEVFGVFKIKAIHPRNKFEVILNIRKNIYFNYKMFLEGSSNLKEIKLITKN